MVRSQRAVSASLSNVIAKCSCPRYRTENSMYSLTGELERRLVRALRRWPKGCANGVISRFEQGALCKMRGAKSNRDPRQKL